jgi:hypothetical protein
MFLFYISVATILFYMHDIHCETTRFSNIIDNWNSRAIFGFYPRHNNIQDPRMLQSLINFDFY